MRPPFQEDNLRRVTLIACEDCVLRENTNRELYEGLSDARFPLVLVYFKVWPKTSLVPELSEVWALVDKSYSGRTDLLPMTSNHHKTCYFPGPP